LFDHLLQDEVQDFIKGFQADISQLALCGSPFKNVTVTELIVQIQSRQKAKSKLPTWFNTLGIVYAPKLNLEQTSSELTAAYKQELIQGKTLADITGGFGVDSYFFAQRFEQVHHFEIQKHLSSIVKHNLAQLPKRNVTSHHADAIQAIKQQEFDVIYADPSRRHGSKGKVFFLEDCEPNIPKHLDYLLDRCQTLLVKTSPMLDLSIGMKTLHGVESVHIVAVQNDVKEVLWVLSKKEQKTPEIHTVNFTKNRIQKFQFSWNTPAEISLHAPQKYVYEPNAAIMKSGAFNQMCETFEIAKLHKHSHLYTCNTLVDFPGRRFTVDKMILYSKKEMRRGIDFDKANISTRNFPESVATLRDKWKLKEGGDRYLFFTTIENDKKILLICSKITDEI
tara:strand:+ start:94175 stop:95353 length:1179 start_codon:yes stop_codon:yes gene_type:complete